jgi:hypothetical protein
MIHFSFVIAPVDDLALVNQKCRWDISENAMIFGEAWHQLIVHPDR